MKALVALLLVAVAFAGCTSPTDGFVTPAQDDQGRYVIEMTSGNQFRPAKAEVPAGATILVVNKGGAHNIVSDSSPKAWQDSPLLSPGGEFEIVLDEPGDYPFHCHPHAPAMSGVFRIV